MASDYTVGDLVAEFFTACGVTTGSGIGLGAQHSPCSTRSAAATPFRS